MRFKTLKHKEFRDTFGVIDLVSDPIGEMNGNLRDTYEHEILHCSTPYLYPLTATMEDIISYWEKHDQKTLLEQLKDYDLIIVDLKIIL